MGHNCHCQMQVDMTGKTFEQHEVLDGYQQVFTADPRVQGELQALFDATYEIPAGADGRPVRREINTLARAFLARYNAISDRNLQFCDQRCSADTPWAETFRTAVEPDQQEPTCVRYEFRGSDLVAVYNYATGDPDEFGAGEPWKAMKQTYLHVTIVWSARGLVRRDEVEARTEPDVVIPARPSIRARPAAPAAKPTTSADPVEPGTPPR